MPARVLRFSDYSTAAQYALLTCELPGRGMETLGVLLLDPASDMLYGRLRRDLDRIASAEDAEVLEALEDDLLLKSHEWGAATTLEWLESNLSLTIRVSGREAVTVRDFERTLEDLYRKHVAATIMPFKTHLPRYSLAVAAGPFLTNPEDVQAEEWIEAPRDLKLEPGMFVACIKGRSMEPRIPDGSLCVFRRGVVGSRTGRLVLVRNSELADDNQYTVKRYRSEKVEIEDGFVQTRIRLESLNPAYPSWDLDEDEAKYQVIAEFVRVVD